MSEPSGLAGIPDGVLLQALAVPAYVTDAEGWILSYNTAAAEFWGGRPDLGKARWCGSLRLFRANGSSLPGHDTPIAITLKTGEPVRGVEVVAERPDGTRVRFMPFPTALRNDSGTIVGAVNVLMDISELRRAETDSLLLSAIVASSDDAIVSKTLEGRVTSWNAGAARIFGYSAEEMIGQSITKIIPPHLLQEETYVLSRIRRGEHIDHYETTRVAKDGREVQVSLTVSPLRSRTGEIIGASKVARDISERKQAETAQRMMMGELSHRVKNTLAMVQAIATQSARRSSGAEFITSFTGRVHSLARTHDLLSETRWEGVELSALVQEQVFLGAVDEHISARGPMVTLEAQPALHLAMVLHELGTNARKYGALSTAAGRLSVEWHVVSSAEGNILKLQWQERNGPPVAAPVALGFGMRLIEDGLLAHGGKGLVTFGADGLSCEITLPLRGSVRSTTYAVPNLRGLSGPEMAERARLHGKRILVAEDEPLIALELESMLRDAGCHIVGPFSDPDEAQAALDGGTACDAALLDTNFSGKLVDGLAAKLVARGLPFAFVTGYGPRELPAAFRSAPVVGKPFSKEAIVTVLATLFRDRTAAEVYQLGAVRRS